MFEEVEVFLAIEEGLEVLLKNENGSNLVVLVTIYLLNMKLAYSIMYGSV